MRSMGADVDSSIANGLTSLPPDRVTFRAGVTTVWMQATSGWRNFRQFKKQTIDKSQTRVLAMLNIVGTGMYGRYENKDTSDMNHSRRLHDQKSYILKLLSALSRHHYWGDLHSVDKAVQAGNLANVPVMVDFGEHDPPNSIEACACSI
jgi:dihydroorotase